MSNQPEIPEVTWGLDEGRDPDAGLADVGAEPAAVVDPDTVEAGLKAALVSLFSFSQAGSYPGDNLI